MEYYNYSAELYHHGVKGMKWGVRRYQNPDGSLTEAGKKREATKAYKADRATRYQMESKAFDTGRFAMKYNKLYAKRKNVTDRKVAKDMEKRGELSEKTQKVVRSTDLLKQIRDGYNELNREQIQKIENHVNDMVKKYPEKNVKQTRMYLKDGEKYVNSFNACCENGNVTYNIVPRTVYTNEGKPVTYYAPVKTRHYYFVY